MELLVAGVHLYAVKIKRMTDGRLGLACYAQRELWISARVKPEVRDDIARHEYGHAWEFHVPPPRTDEERMDLQATVAAAWGMELAKAGGPDALMALEPDESDDLPERCLRYEEEARPEVADDLPAYTRDGELIAAPSDPGIEVEIDHASKARGPHGGRAYCVCGCAINDAMVITGTVLWSFKFGGKLVKREAYCDFCKMVIRWTEGVNFYETPNGEVAEGPVFDRRPEARAEFLGRLTIPSARVVTSSAG